MTQITIIIRPDGSCKEDAETIWVARLLFFFPTLLCLFYILLSLFPPSHTSIHKSSHTSTHSSVHPSSFLSSFPSDLIPAGHFFSLSFLFFPSTHAVFSPDEVPVSILSFFYQTQNTTCSKATDTESNLGGWNLPIMHWGSTPLSSSILLSLHSAIFLLAHQPTHQPKSRPTACVSACG